MGNRDLLYLVNNILTKPKVMIIMKGEKHVDNNSLAYLDFVNDFLQLISNKMRVYLYI